MVTQMTSEVIIENKNSGETDISPLGSLFRIGRKQSFVTYDDILQFVPNPELNLDYVDQIFACLLCAGIPFGEDRDHLEHIDGLVDKPDNHL